jgi:hypothetical protein
MLPGSLACSYDVGTAALADGCGHRVLVYRDLRVACQPPATPAPPHGTKTFWHLDAPSFAGLNANETCAPEASSAAMGEAGRSVKVGWLAVSNPFAEVKRS